MIKHVSLAVISLLVVMVLSVGCGDQKLDTSNDQTYSESLKLIYEAVPEGEREEFRKNYSAVLSEKFRTGSKTLKEDEMYSVYSMAKAFGGPKGSDGLLSINGLTASDISEQGQVIRKKKKEDKIARQKKRIEDNIKETKEKITNLEAEVVKDENFAKAHAQVEVIADKVEALEGFNFEKKSWGTVGSFVVYITIKNNSSESVKYIEGDATIKDKSGKKVNTIWLSNLRRPEDKSHSRNLNIAPGTEWTGTVALNMTKDKKYPFPLITEYSATLSDVKITLDSASNRSSYSAESRVQRLTEAKSNLIKLEKELASIQ